MAHECEYCGRPNKAPQGKKAHERNCSQNPDYKEPKHIIAKREREQAKAENPNNICPECAAAGEERALANPGALAHHRLRTHGVESVTTRQRAKSRQHKKNKSETNGHDSTVELVGVVGELPTTPAAIRKHLRAQQAHREDLVQVVQIVYPGGIPTDDSERLDQSLSYIFGTAQVLADRVSS